MLGLRVPFGEAEVEALGELATDCEAWALNVGEAEGERVEDGEREGVREMLEQAEALGVAESLREARGVRLARGETLPVPELLAQTLREEVLLRDALPVESFVTELEVVPLPEREGEAEGEGEALGLRLLLCVTLGEALRVPHFVGVGGWEALGVPLELALMLALTVELPLREGLGVLLALRLALPESVEEGLKVSTPVERALAVTLLLEQAEAVRGVDVEERLPLALTEAEGVGLRVVLMLLEALELREVRGEREAETESVPLKVGEAEKEGDGLLEGDCGEDMLGVGLLE
jgi:hypothetical protein